MYGVLVDVSCSMESAYALDSSHHANVQHIHAIITTLANIVKSEVAHHERKDEIFASAFGVQAGSVMTCDLLALIDVLNEEGGCSKKDANLDLLIDLAKREGVSRIEPWIKKTLTEFQAKFLYKAVNSDRDLLRKLVDKLPSSVYTTAAKVGDGAAKAVDYLGKMATLGQAEPGLSRAYNDRVENNVRDSEAYHEAEKIIKECIISTLKKIEHPRPKLVNGVSDQLDNLLHYQVSPQDHQLSESVHGRIQELIEPIKPYIFGWTPMRQACANAEAAFQRTTATPKVLFVLSDGQSKDGDPREIARRLRDAEVTIITCFLTKNDVENPKRLLDPRTELQNSGCQVLFEMSSTMKNTAAPVSYLTDVGWELPESGECRLFVQANSLDVVSEFCKVLVAQFTSPCDALVHLLEKVPLAKYINKQNADFIPKEQEGGTCYAHAIATVFHLAMHRIVGRKGGIPKFKTIRDRLIGEYGVQGANTEKVLERVCPEYRLHYCEVDEGGARQAINNRRPVVARFRLNNEQWKKFGKFFVQRPKGILTKADVVDTTYTQLSGHAVVLIRCAPSCLTFMNSWGTNFADEGFFRVQDKNALNCMQFYDIYWNEEDLLPSEKEAYRRSCTERAKQLATTFPSVQELLHECPSCKENSKVSEFLGHILEAECPLCHYKFTPTNEAILKSLYTRKFK